MLSYFLVSIAVGLLTYLMCYRLIKKATKADQQVALLTEMVELQARTLAAMPVTVVSTKTDEEYLEEARRGHHEASA